MTFPASLEDTSSPQIPISQSYLDGQNAYAASQASPFTHTDSSSNTSAATQVLPAPSTLGLPIITPSVKQKANGSTGSGGKTLAVAFPNNVTDGNSIVVLMGMGEVEAAGITLAITDSQGNTYTQAVKGSNSTTQEAAIFYTTNTQLGANTVTATIAGGSSVNTAISMEIYEVEGLITVSSLIVDQTASNNNVGSTAISTANITPNYPNELAFMAVAAAGGTIAVGTGWASDTGGALSPSGGNLVSFGAQSRFQMTQGPLVPAATLGTSNAWAACTAVFRPMHLPIEGTHLIQGGFTEQASLSAGSLNADLVASTDVSAYKWFSLQLNGNAFSGTLTFQCSNDNATWTACQAMDMSQSNGFTTTFNGNSVCYSGMVAFRFLRVRMTAYTSGTAQATLELYTTAPAVLIGKPAVSQAGTWTVQPGNTANTTPWLESIHDGTNKANVLPATSVSNAIGSQGALLIGGAFAEQASLTAGSLNADLVASTDVSNYKSFSLQITGAWVGTLTLQGSNDNVNFTSISGLTPDTASGWTSTTTSNKILVGAVSYHYLRVRMTSYTSGTANGTLELYTAAPFTPSTSVTVFEGGTWTVQPGNTANTTPWLESIHDGTNKANVLPATSVSNAIGSQGALLTGGAFAEQASLSAGSLNADLVPSTDVSNYKSFSIQITGVWTGTIQFQGSNDNVNFSLIDVGSQANTQPVTSTGINGLWYGFCGFRYLRVRVSSYTSGTANGVLELYTQSLSALNVLATAGQSGTWTVQPGNTANTTPWLTSTHDGTNKANVLAATSVSNAIGSQGALLTGGAFAEQASLSAGSLNADLVASTDVSNYKKYSIQVTGVWSGTITAQASNDNANWLTIADNQKIDNQAGPTTAIIANDIYTGSIKYRFLRVRMTSYTSGTANGVLELYTSDSYMIQTQLAAAQSGAWSVGPASDVTLIASAAQTTTQTTADQTNQSGKGIRVVLDMTSVGTGSVTLEIDAKDVASGKYVALLTGAAVTTNSTNVYVVYPGLTPAANAVVSDVLPRSWRVKVTANNANTATYSVGASYLS